MGMACTNLRRGETANETVRIAAPGACFRAGQRPNRAGSRSGLICGRLRGRSFACWFRLISFQKPAWACWSLGVAEPLPSWGNLLAELQRPEAVRSNPWLLAPLGLLMIVMICLEMLQSVEAVAS